MSNAIRVENVEESFQDLHGIKPQIYCEIISNNDVVNRLVYGGKEIVLREVIERGLTKDAFLTYNGETKRFDRVFEAEQEAVKILRS